MAVRKNISITQEQELFLTKNNISLSKLAQQAIRQRMEDLQFARLTTKNLREMERGKYEERDFDAFIEQMKRWSKSGSFPPSRNASRGLKSER